MGSKKTQIILSSIAGLLLIGVIIGIVMITSPSGDIRKEEGSIDEIPFTLPTTEITEIHEKLTMPPTTIPQANVPAATTETAAKSAEEQYVEQFLAEANRYTQTEQVEPMSTDDGKKVFFHVVTDGTVSDDDSLEGLTSPVKEIGEIVLRAGFRFDKNQKIFYSDSQSWQRNWGFSPLYDAGAAFVGMYYDTIRLKFTYNDYDWLFQIWKGRYGITTGGEMGIYYKPKGSDSSFYSAVPDSETVTMSFALYRGNDLYMTRGPEPNWWLTGFKLFDMVAPHDLTMHATYFMNNSEMADQLEKSIVDLGFIKDVNYQRIGLTMTIIWK